MPLPDPPLASPLVVASRAEIPVLLSVPHAGRDYPQWLVDLASGGRDSLESLEDPFVDRLVMAALDWGIGAVIALAPRAAIDCNRAEDDIDPATVRSAEALKVSPRARGGLGIVPARSASHTNLWRSPIRIEELEERIAQAHRPYHLAISDGLNALVERFGTALLIDCHSMPSPPRGGPDVVIGDRYGRTAARWLTAEAMRAARQAGYTTALNEPYAGGHVIARHGLPRSGIHALQLEIDRHCYLAPGTRRPGPGFGQARDFILSLGRCLGEALLERGLPAAAE